MVALGVILLLGGVLLLVAEAHVPTAGALGAAGVAALAAGCWLVVTGSGAGLAIALPAAAAVAVTGAVGLTFAGRKVLTAGRRPTGSGVEALRGAKATVRAWERGAGQVAVAGGLWRARLAWPQDEEDPPRPGDSVIVEGVEGLTLAVRRAEPWEMER